MSRLTAAVALLGLLCLASPARGDEFSDGLELFRRGQFRDAAAKWEALRDGGVVSSRLFTNIGNARAFAGDLGEAVLSWRRALVVDPGDDRARQGLESVRRTLGVTKAGRSAESGLLHALFFWHWATPFPVRRALFAILWLGGFALLFAGFCRRRLRFAGLALVFLGAVMLTSLAISDSEGPGLDQAVLMVRTEGRAGDGPFYSPSHSAPFPAGVELTILERRADWVHARLRDGTTTWLPAPNVMCALTAK